MSNSRALKAERKRSSHRLAAFGSAHLGGRPDVLPLEVLADLGVEIEALGHGAGDPVSDGFVPDVEAHG